MPTETSEIETLANREYKWGFVTDIESDSAPPGLNEEIVRFISLKKAEPDWMLQWRLKAFRHWQTMQEPTHWPMLHYPKINYQDIIYYSAPKKLLNSLDEVDPELLATYEKLGIPLHEREMLAGVAVDAVFDSVSVKTTFQKSLAEKGIIFCSFSEAVKDHPELVRQYLGSVVPYSDQQTSTKSVGEGDHFANHLFGVGCFSLEFEMMPFSLTNQFPEVVEHSSIEVYGLREIHTLM